MKLSLRELERYSRQIVLKNIGVDGQEKLRKSRVAIVGLGALGCISSTLLVRAGVGEVLLVDRDFIELSNLQRQVLYDEEDIEKGLPKAIAAAEKLSRVNSDVKVTPIVDDLNYKNIGELFKGVDLILDCTDNFETRFLINDYSVKSKTPWIYAAAISTHGMTMNVIPGETPCFRCLIDEPPPPGSTPTCETAGIFNPIPSIIASIQTAEAVKILLEKDYLKGKLVVYDVWDQSFNIVQVFKRENCPSCSLGRYDFLSGKRAPGATVLCGQNAVQVTLPRADELDLEGLAENLKSIGVVKLSKYFLKFKYKGYELAIFPNGRIIVKGTSEPNTAVSLVSRFVGL